MASTWIVYLFYWPQNNVQMILAKWKNTLHGTWYVQRRRRRRVNNGDLSFNQQPPPKRKRKIERERMFYSNQKAGPAHNIMSPGLGETVWPFLFPSNFSSTPFHSPGFTRKLLCSPISIFIDSPRFAQDRTLIVANCLPACFPVCLSSSAIPEWITFSWISLHRRRANFLQATKIYGAFYKRCRISA